jgi:hypothetical protein
VGEVAVGFSYVVAFAFVVAGVSKIADPTAILTLLLKLRTPFKRLRPLSAQRLIRVFGIAETLLGVLLAIATGDLAVAVSVLASALLLAFAMFVRFAIKSRMPCGCFGSKLTARAADFYRTVLLAGMGCYLSVAKILGSGNLARFSNTTLTTAVVGVALLVLVSHRKREPRPRSAADSHIGETPSMRRRAFIRGAASLGALGLVGASGPAWAFSEIGETNGTNNENEGSGGVPAGPPPFSVSSSTLSDGLRDTLRDLARNDSSMQLMLSQVASMGFIVDWSNVRAEQVTITQPNSSDSPWSGALLYVGMNKGRIRWTPGRGDPLDPIGRSFAIALVGMAGRDRLLITRDGVLQNKFIPSEQWADLGGRRMLEIFANPAQFGITEDCAQYMQPCADCLNACDDDAQCEACHENAKEDCGNCWEAAGHICLESGFDPWVCIPAGGFCGGLCGGEHANCDNQQYCSDPCPQCESTCNNGWHQYTECVKGQ